MAPRTGARDTQRVSLCNDLAESSICGDPNLLQKLYEQYDHPEGPRLFSKLVSSLGKPVHEKPNLLGSGSQMQGLGLPSTAAEGPNKDSGYFDMGLGIMASAASAGVSTVSSMMSNTGGLGNHSEMKLRL